MAALQAPSHPHLTLVLEPDKLVDGWRTPPRCSLRNTRSLEVIILLAFETRRIICRVSYS